MNNDFAKRPWEVAAKAGWPFVMTSGQATISVGGYSIAELRANPEHGQELLALAHFIAAEPELYAALKEMCLCFGSGEESDEWWYARHDDLGPGGQGMTSMKIREYILSEALAAIARAEGRQA